MKATDILGIDLGTTFCAMGVVDKFGKPTIVTTNTSFAEWNEVFPNAACVVALIDRLVHRSEIVEIQGDSYRFKEAKERKVMRAKERASKSKTQKKSTKSKKS